MKPGHCLPHHTLSTQTRTRTTWGCYPASGPEGGWRRGAALEKAPSAQADTPHAGEPGAPGNPSQVWKGRSGTTHRGQAWLHTQHILAVQTHIPCAMEAPGSAGVQMATRKPLKFIPQPSLAKVPKQEQVTAAGKCRDACCPPGPTETLGSTSCPAPGKPLVCGTWWPAQVNRTDFSVRDEPRAAPAGSCSLGKHPIPEHGHRLTTEPQDPSTDAQGSPQLIQLPCDHWCTTDESPVPQLGSHIQEQARAQQSPSQRQALRPHKAPSREGAKSALACGPGTGLCHLALPVPSDVSCAGTALRLWFPRKLRASPVSLHKGSSPLLSF